MYVGFFSLPAEVRISIYHLILADPNKIPIVPYFSDPVSFQLPLTEGPVSSRSRSDLSLLLLNRQSYAEAVSILYKSNIFLFQTDLTGVSLSHMHRFLSQIGMENLNHLRHIRIRLIGYSLEPDRPFRMLCRGHNLRLIDIRVVAKDLNNGHVPEKSYLFRFNFDQHSLKDCHPSVPLIDRSASLLDHSSHLIRQFLLELSTYFKAIEAAA